MAEAPVMPELSSDYISEFRHTYIRDDWDGARGLSRYNNANKAQFFTDDDLRLLEGRLRSDMVEEMDAVYEDKQTERTEKGDDETAAAAAAEAVRWEARLRLLRAACYRLMMADPAFRASLIVGDRGSSIADRLFAGWADQIEEDEGWTRSRSGEYGSIRIERL